MYIEALKGREYEIRLRNPYPVRVAVALSVDGLNTIDARHTSAAGGAQVGARALRDTITISGWQTSMTDARRFEFTSEEQSYGAWLGKTNDLGVISAVFFRERVPERDRADGAGPGAAGRRLRRRPDRTGKVTRRRGRCGVAGWSRIETGGGAPAPAADEYAATGIGRRTDHAVRQVYLDLEPTPAASVSIRYEYRAQLVRLGVLPPVQAAGDPLDRRERARGFDAVLP